jgi:hypothetical protein
MALLASIERTSHELQQAGLWHEEASAAASKVGASFNDRKAALDARAATEGMLSDE